MKYSYNYDANGRVSEKYKDGTIEVRYEYLKDHLVKETQYYKSGDKEILCKYDASGLLLTKKENGKIIEKNSYNNGRLMVV